MVCNSHVRDAALHSERIDTHAHLAEKYSGLQEDAALYGHFDTTAPLNDARIKAEGCRVLYGIDPGSHLLPDAPPELFRAAAELRKKGAWGAVCHALDRAKITRQITFTSTKPTDATLPFAKAPHNGRLAWLAYIDDGANGHFEYPCPDFNVPGFSYYRQLSELFGELKTMDDYLAALDAAIDSWRSFGVVGMKTAMAYTSGLAVSDPTLGEARQAFVRKNDMTLADFRPVRDFAFRHALLACKRNALPVVIHTGFQIWGHSTLAQSNPMLLHPLLVDPRYKGMTLVLLHGGNPYVGETTYLAGMFPNVIIDFTWIGWVTPPRFRQALAEWLAVVPNDRLCWGSDSCGPESIAGVDSVIRRLIADVLEESIKEGTIDERYALEFVENTYVNTPKRVFGLR